MSSWRVRMPKTLRTGRCRWIYPPTWSPPFENRGLSSIDHPVRVDLYFNGVLVAWRQGDGAIAGGFPSRVTWSGLQGIVPVTPGEHTLKVVVDPTNLIQESDETNNVFEKVFTWNTGAVPAKPAPTRPAPPRCCPSPWGLPIFSRDGSSTRTAPSRSSTKGTRNTILR